MKLLKKRLVRILALCMSVILMFTMFLFPELVLSAAENTSYSATLFDMGNSSTNNTAYGSVVNKNSTDLTPEISATSLSFGWSGATLKNNTGNYMYLCTTNSNSTTDTYKVTETSALMFYVKMPDSAPENELFFQFVASDRGDAATNGAVQWIAPLKNSKIYYLQKGYTEWEERIAPQSHIAGQNGNVYLPAGYEGWVRIPYESLSLYAEKSKELFRLNFYLKSVGGEYTQGGVTLGTFMLVENGTESYTNVTFDGLTEKSLLVEYPCHNTHLITPQSVSGADITDNETVISDGYTYSLSDKNAEVTVNDSTVVSKSVISYIRSGLGDTNKVKITVNGITPAANSDVYLLNRGSKVWSTVQIDSDSFVALPDGFEGYLMLPSSLYSGLEGNAVTKINFQFEKTGALFGCIMLSDKVDTFTVIRMDSGSDYVYLTKKAYYNAELIETEDTVTSNIADNTYYTATSKVSDNSFSVGIDDGYYYEMSVGSAAVGEYELDSNVVEPPYTAYTAKNFTKPSGRYQRPYYQTAYIIEETGDLTTPFASKELTFSAGTVCTDTDDSTYLNTQTGVYSNLASYGSKYYAEPNFTGISWTTTGAVMFYVKSSGTKDSQMHIMNANQWVFLQKDAKYYRLADDEAQWEECTAVFNKQNAGNFVIPAGFSGWIRIPTTSFAKHNGNAATAHSMTRLEFFPGLLGGEYGTISVSHIMTVDEGGKNYLTASPDGNAAVKLTTASTVKKFNVTIGSVSGEKTFVTDAPAGDLYSTISLKQQAVFSTEQALMFYVRQSGRTASSLRVELGDTGMKMHVGAAYHLYDAEGEYWSGYTAADDGKMSVPGGFSGWIRIPYSSFADSEKQTDPDGFNIDKILVTPYQLGGAYGTLKIGSFVLTNHGTEDLTTMRVNKNAEVPISARGVYTAKMLTPSEIYPAGDNARKVVAEKENWPLLDGGYLYNVASINEKVSMNSTSALEIELSSGTAIDGEDGIIFYVKLPTAKENAVILDGVFKTSANSNYYTLAKGNDSVWKTGTANNDGSLPLESGFDGYIKVPFTSMTEVPSGEITEFIFGLKNIGGEYGNSIFGSFMLSDNINLNLTDVYVDSLAYTQTLIQSEYYEGYVLQGTTSVEGDASLLSVSTVDGNVLTPNIPEGYAYKVTATGDEINLAAKEYTPRMIFTVDELYRSKLKSCGAIMFYVDMTDCAENTMFLQAVGDVYATTAMGSRYSVLKNGNSYWEEHISDGNGDITFEQSFSGWVRIPYTSLKNASGVYLNANIKQLNFTFKNVGGDYGEPKVASVTMLSNNGDFGSLKLAGYTDKISLYGSNGKTVYSREDIAIWKSVTDPFVAYSDGEEISITATIDKEVEAEVNTVFSAKATYNTPFAAKGIEISSTNALYIHGDQLPRVTIASPFSVRGGKGLVYYIEVPENDTGVNSVFFQLKTDGGNKWLSVKDKYEWMIPVLEKGETEWQYVFVSNQRVQLNSGFKGYVYIPYEAFTTHPNATTGVYRCLEETDVIVNMFVGVEAYGGDIGNIKVGGVFVSENGILSHNGAYVDGDTVCRDVFGGEAVDEDKVRYSIYDAPRDVGSNYKNLPVPTAEDYVIFKDNLTGRSTDIFFEAYPGATKYRCDVYKTTCVTGSTDKIYYEYINSVWTDTTNAHIDGLVTATYYTVVVTAFNGDEGLAIYALCPVRPEAQVVGDMYVTDDDPYKYEWGTGDLAAEEWEYEEIWEEVYEETDIEEDDDDEKKTLLKKTFRRRKKGGLPTWAIILIISGSVLAAAAVTFLIIIIVKKKKRRNG